MNKIFMNSENRKTSDQYKLVLHITDKMDLIRGDKLVALSYLNIYYTWTNMKTSYKNNKLKISASA